MPIHDSLHCSLVLLCRSLSANKMCLLGIKDYLVEIQLWHTFKELNAGIQCLRKFQNAIPQKIPLVTSWCCYGTLIHNRHSIKPRTSNFNSQVSDLSSPKPQVNPLRTGISSSSFFFNLFNIYIYKNISF